MSVFELAFLHLLFSLTEPERAIYFSIVTHLLVVDDILVD